ncbi:MAG: RimK family alpha-L-glutamate ligase [Bdellovibrionales bacterium CG10_big_fil_rev_8_21_14_0_10_45_34]|nr:MAG: RimK family alpha-L-glutamate ligase [Bdellovibrionales bacterium CG10_big_fil_rev_8_21_14_0_10_45_34]
MTHIIVVSDRKDWPVNVPQVEVIEASDYLTNEKYHKQRFRIFNLCQSYSYLSEGYYVSLLAEARSHRPIPSVATILDFKARDIFRITSDELSEIIQKSLHNLVSSQFELSIYFGRNTSKRYERLSRALFDAFRSPFVKASFEKKKGKWAIKSIRPISFSDIPKNHMSFVVECAEAYFRRSETKKSTKKYRYNLALLTNPQEKFAPSDEAALDKMERAFEKQSISVDFITRKDFSRLPTFDALFIRETTSVNHYTYSFARRAVAEGLVVIDDPTSILRCCNKVFLNEILEKNKIARPKTLIVAESNSHQSLKEIGLPCVLKLPDSSFSQGVYKANSLKEYIKFSELVFAQSELMIVQEFVKTDFDWRVGVLGGKAIYVCRYFMARSHWQIIKSDGSSAVDYGKAECFALSEVNPELISTAERAAECIGDGLYGVDIKQVGNKFFVIEINDNPTLESQVEDRILKNELYDIIAKHFLTKLDSR